MSPPGEPEAHPPVTRSQIIAALIAALEPLDYVHALWQGGAAAFRRADEWSDVDLHIDVADERVDDVFAEVEAALQRLAPIDLKYEVPQPTWHGHAQAFYRLADASPFHLVDVAVMKHSSEEKFLEIERHGDAVVAFDRAGVVQPPPLDWSALRDRLAARAADLRTRFDLFQVLALKELERGNEIDALLFYQAMSLRPLVEALRMKHQPARHDFGPRYLAYDLPAEVVAKLKALYFVANGDDIRAWLPAVAAWFHQTLDELDFGAAPFGREQVAPRHGENPQGQSGS